MRLGEHSKYFYCLNLEWNCSSSPQDLLRGAGPSMVPGKQRERGRSQDTDVLLMGMTTVAQLPSFFWPLKVPPLLISQPLLIAHMGLGWTFKIHIKIQDFHYQIFCFVPAIEWVCKTDVDSCSKGAQLSWKCDISQLIIILQTNASRQGFSVREWLKSVCMWIGFK